MARPRQSSATTLAVLAAHADLIPPDRQNDKVKLLAVRGYYRDSMGVSGKNDRGIYDDALFVVSPNGVWPFNFNVDPSKAREGIASIKADQAVQYRPGMHGISGKNPYRAFRQNAKCWVHRDGQKDDHGMFYVNLHKGGRNTTSSLGCMTVTPSQWGEVRDRINAELKAAGQRSFYVVLLEYAGNNPPVPYEMLEPDTVPIDLVPEVVHEILDADDKTATGSTTNIAAVVGSAAGITAAGRQIADNASSMMNAAPWLVCGVVVVGSAIWVMRERRLRAHRSRCQADLEARRT